MNPETGADSAGRRDVNPAVALALIRYVETALGPQGLLDLVAELCGSPSLDEVTDPGRWWSADEFADLVHTAGALTGDPDLGRRVGEQALRDTLGTPQGELILAFGTTEAATAMLTEYGSRLSVGRNLRLVESSPRSASIEGVSAGASESNLFSCGFTAGFFAALPALFGDMGTVAEVGCERRGDPACLFRVAWRPDPSRKQQQDVDEHERLTRGLSAAEQIEDFHRMTAEWVSAQAVGEVLERIVASAAAAIAAHRFVLAVQLEGETEARIHQLGFPAGSERAFIEQIEAGGAPGRETVIGWVRSDHADYGRFAAVFAPGAIPNEYDKRLVRSFAKVAASAIEIVAALESARRDRDAIGALLGLTTALSEARDVATAARKLAHAMPRVSGCDSASVWLLDSAEGAFVLAESREADGSVTAVNVERIPVEWVEPLLPRLRDGRAFYLDAAAVEEMLRPTVPTIELGCLAVLPILVSDDLTAVVTAGWFSDVSSNLRTQIHHLLEGIGGQARLAFENALLIEDMRHQTLHDDLTGLPKRALVEDRCEQALTRRARTGEEVAVLFVDVDDFKVVNDSLGHNAGDELLRQFSGRLTGLLRASDTCARVGGDEFIVVLVDPATPGAAQEVASRFLRALDVPFEIAGDHVTVSASIGVSWAGQGARTFEDLVQRADEAMYRAKESGKNRAVFAG